MAKRSPIIDPGDRPHRARLASTDPRKRIVRHAITERIGTTTREIGNVHALEAADHVDLLARILSPDQAATAREIHELWHAVRQRTTCRWGEPGGGINGAYDRKGPRDILNACFRIMGSDRSVEVIAVVCEGEAFGPGGRPRDMGLVREGLDTVGKAGVLGRSV